MNDQRQAFSHRLAEAIRKAGYELRRDMLNSHYVGPPVREMSASRWLGGKAIPSQDKQQVLVDLFGVEPQEL